MCVRAAGAGCEAARNTSGSRITEWLEVALTRFSETRSFLHGISKLYAYVGADIQIHSPSESVAVSYGDFVEMLLKALHHAGIKLPYSERVKLARYFGLGTNDVIPEPEIYNYDDYGEWLMASVATELNKDTNLKK